MADAIGDLKTEDILVSQISKKMGGIFFKSKY